MKKVDSLLQAEPKELVTNWIKSQGTQQKEQELKAIWVSALFKKIQARYGHKWNSAIEGIEDFAVSEWAKGLSGLTGDQIKNGLDKLVDPWPPTMPEFKDLCLGIARDEWGSTMRIPPPYRFRSPISDEQKKKNREAGKRGLEKMRRILGDV